MDSGVIAMSSLINTTLTVTLFVHVTLTSPDSELVFKELRLSFWLSSSVIVSITVLLLGLNLSFACSV